MTGVLDAPLTGRLLVASPDLLDPNFRRTVVLVVEHSAAGALGVVLDRPITDLDVRDVLPEWHAFVVDPSVLFDGGPVQQDGAIGIGRLQHPCVEPAPWGVPIDHHLVRVDLSASADAVHGSLAGLRVYAGYAGWSAGQLDAEIARGDWFVIEAEPGDPWRDVCADLWREVLERQGGRLAVFARFPDDPSAN
ncbi:MAG: YqgE/AlgH family protein [Actinomycetes bacterium]